MGCSSITSMRDYIIRRLFLILPTFLGITFVTFFTLQLAPGSPITLAMGMDGLKSNSVSQAIVEKTKHMYGLDQPLPVQYGRWLKRLVRLDFGKSFKDGRPVIRKISEALPITIVLNVLSMLIIYLVSIPLGIASAIRRGAFWDKVVTLKLFLLYSLPSFWVGTVLILFFATGEYFDFFPIGGLLSVGAERLSWGARGLDWGWHLVLPVVTLSYGGFAFLARFTRASFLEVVSQEYIRCARAKGLAERAIWGRHAMRNAMIPLLTLMSTLLPALIGGSVIVEQIFSIPGMGRLGFEAVLSRDYPVVMGIETISALLTLISILVTDIFYAVVDPRVSFEKVAV